MQNRPGRSLQRLLEPLKLRPARGLRLCRARSATKLRVRRREASDIPLPLITVGPSSNRTMVGDPKAQHPVSARIAAICRQSSGPALDRPRASLVHASMKRSEIEATRARAARAIGPMSPLNPGAPRSPSCFFGGRASCSPKFEHLTVRAPRLVSARRSGRRGEVGPLAARDPAAEVEDGCPRPRSSFAHAGRAHSFNIAARSGPSSRAGREWNCDRLLRPRCITLGSGTLAPALRVGAACALTGRNLPACFVCRT